MKRFFTLLVILALCLCWHTKAYASSSATKLKGPVMADALQVKDGDTITVQVQIWLNQYITTNVRIRGIDAPELHGKCQSEINRAIAARNEIISLIKSGKVEIFNIHDDKYAGRILAYVKTSNGTNIANYMITKGLVRPYFGKKRIGWCS